jgi:Putative DNA-binding domain
MGRAEDLFLRMKHGGAEEVTRMIADQVVEELFLDYKRAGTVAPFRKLDDSDKKNLAKAIAGFANSEGGVIVWGVDCRQNPPHGDVPTGPVPIDNPTAFKSLLEGAITGATLPAHPGVENVAVNISGQTDGFVITHIPVGLNVPYRTLGDKQEYYIRAGSNFLPTPHAVLAGLFGRAPHPELNIDVRFLGQADAYSSAWPCKLKFEIYVVNDGRGIAEELFFSAETKLPTSCNASFPVTEQWRHWRITKDGRDRFTMISSAFPHLPPGTENLVVELLLIFGNAVADDIVIDLVCGTRNGPGVARTITLPRTVMAAALEHYTHLYDTPAEKMPGDDLHKWRIANYLAK